MIPTAGFGNHGLGRGVYIAPWMGPNDELVLMALTTRRHLACDPVTVPAGASRLGAADKLWRVLDEVDPESSPMLRAI